MQLQSYRNLSKSACWLPQNPFYREFFGNQKVPGNCFQATFFIQFFDNKFYFVILHKPAKFHYQSVYFPRYSLKCVSCFMLRHSRCHDVRISEKLKTDYLKNKNRKLSKWNKKHFSLLRKCSLLDMQDKLAKM